jgi:iron complex outermembrane receptor protein
MIPLSAVDRVEILADGASALYGADAIGGVVNVILRRDVTGADSGLRYSAATDGGSSQYMASQVVGHSWSTGNAMLTYEYSDDHGLDSRERNYVPDLGGTLLLLPQQIRQNLVKERLFGQRRW